MFCPMLCSQVLQRNSLNTVQRSRQVWIPLWLTSRIKLIRFNKPDFKSGFGVPCYGYSRSDFFEKWSDFIDFPIEENIIVV